MPLSVRLSVYYVALVAAWSQRLSPSRFDRHSSVSVRGGCSLPQLPPYSRFQAASLLFLLCFLMNRMHQWYDFDNGKFSHRSPSLPNMTACIAFKVILSSSSKCPESRRLGCVISHAGCLQLHRRVHATQSSNFSWRPRQKHLPSPFVLAKIARGKRVEWPWRCPLGPPTSFSLRVNVSLPGPCKAVVQVYGTWTAGDGERECGNGGGRHRRRLYGN